MERYIDATYIDRCQPYIMTKSRSTFPNPEIPKIIPDTGAKRPKANRKMTYFKKNNIDKNIHKKLMKKDVY